MGFWSDIKNAFRSKSSDSVGNELRDAWNQWGTTDAGVMVNSWSAMFHGPVLAAVSILSEDVAKIPWGVYRRLPNGGKEPLKEHYLYRLLREPNNWQTALEFKEMMQSALVLRGNAHAVIVRDWRGVPQYLVPVHPDRVTLYEAPGGEWFYLVTRNGLHEMAVLRDVPIMVPSEDVLHIRWLSQWHSLLGGSRVTMGRQPIGLSMSLEEHHARFAGQGARPSGYLKTQQKLAKEVREQLASEWQKNKGGPRNAGATAVLEQGLEWQSLGMTMVDAEYMASREFQLREVARVFRLPPYKLGIQGTDSGPSMVQQGQEYLNSVLSGYCERWKAKLEKQFELDGEENFIFWDYGHFLKADIQTRFTAYRMAVGGPWMAPNEARREDGLPDVPFGDDVMRAGNTVPLGTPPSASGSGGAGSDTTGTPAPGGDGSPDRLPSDDEPAPGV